MAATTTLLGLVTPTQGTLSGTWGDTVNYGISDYVDTSVAGTLTLTNDGAVTLANTTGSSAGSNITSTLTGAGTVTAQFAIVRVTGTLTVAKVVTGPSYSKTYTVVNAATGGIVTFKASGQTGVSIAVGESAFVYYNGTDYVKVSGTASVTSFQTSLSGLTPSTATTGVVTLAGTLGVASGGTSLATLTANNVILGNGTSAPLFVAPSTSGNVLTSNGTTWASTAPATSGDVVGPASAVANSIALFNSTTGKLIKDSSASDGLIYGLTVGRGLAGVATNTAVGASALAANTTGDNSTAVGYQALKANTTGQYNVAVGTDSLKSNTTGGFNVSAGRESMATNTTGANNSAFGYASLVLNTTGANNVAVGMQALLSNTTASNSTAVGYQAGLNNNGSVGNNVFIGYQAGTNSTTGNQVILIGAGSQPSAAGSGNEIVIGTLNVTSKGGSTGFISPNGGGVYQGNNSATWSITSDQRLKKNIVDNNIGLSAINAIKVRNFEYRTVDEITDLPKLNAIAITGVQLGVIAQELQAVLPDCVKTESTGVMSVQSDNLTWYMINAIKELKAEFDAYKASHP